MTQNVQSKMAGEGFLEWSPAEQLKSLLLRSARLSRGFMRCKPAKWFPGFNAHWHPLLQALGLDMNVGDVLPRMETTEELVNQFMCTIDDEPFVIGIDANSKKRLIEAIAPDSKRPAQELLMEYLARRLLATLKLAWSGAQFSSVLFDSDLDAKSFRYYAVAELQLNIGGNHSSVWCLMGKLLVEKLDGLWKRQVHSTQRIYEEGAEINLEVASIAVPTSLLSEYLASATIVDLETPLSDDIIIAKDDKGWARAKLFNIDDHFAIETTSTFSGGRTIPEGNTKISVILGKQHIDGSALSEITQPGAIWQSELSLTNNVELIINSQVAGIGKLGVYEGNFAVKVG